MKLISLELEGYKRFFSKQKLNLDAPVVALLGPNEAGKTSILNSLTEFNNSDPIITSGASQVTTKQKKFDEEHIILSIKYLIDNNDKKKIANIEEAKNVRFYILQKKINGEKIHDTIPPITRNLEQRKYIIKLLSDYQEKLRPIESENGDLEPNQLKVDINAFITKINEQENEENLDEELLQDIENILNSFQENEDEESISLAEKITSWHSSELEHPQKKALDVLHEGVHQFLLFSENDRQLKPTYDLDKYFSNQPEEIPNALNNLASSAELSLEDLHKLTVDNDQGEIETLLEKVNKNIREKMLKSWSQSDVHIKLRVSDTNIHILAGDKRYENIDQRSEGMRQFIALLAFLTKNKISDKPIVLLIDEAETHLHYDAQADIIQTLSKQFVSEKVIYSTHSFACLPEDLGLGVRILEEEEEFSKIKNKFWGEGGLGLSPLLFGMGASTMAFLPIRFGLLTEGVVDMLLLPSLFREVTNRKELGFQISPGLSEVNYERLTLLQKEAKRVAYLVDNDDGGKEIKNKLKRAGVPEDLIINLDSNLDNEVVIEDFISIDLYVKAINEEFTRSGVYEILKNKDIGNSNRPDKLKKWCEDRSISVPKKIDIAYRILDHLNEHSLVETSKVDVLKETYNRVCNAIEFKN